MCVCVCLCVRVSFDPYFKLLLFRRVALTRLLSIEEVRSSQWCIKGIFVQNVDYYPLLHVQSSTPLPHQQLPIHQSSTIPPVCLFEGRVSTSSEGSEKYIFCFFSRQ